MKKLLDILIITVLFALLIAVIFFGFAIGNAGYNPWQWGSDSRAVFAISFAFCGIAWVGFIAAIVGIIKIEA